MIIVTRWNLASFNKERRIFNNHEVTLTLIHWLGPLLYYWKYWNKNRMAMTNFSSIEPPAHMARNVSETENNNYIIERVGREAVSSAGI